MFKNIIIANLKFLAAYTIAKSAINILERANLCKANADRIDRFMRTDDPAEARVLLKELEDDARNRAYARKNT